jgi:hypothetical protein
MEIFYSHINKKRFLTFLIVVFCCIIIEIIIIYNDLMFNFPISPIVVGVSSGLIFGPKISS